MSDDTQPETEEQQFAKNVKFPVGVDRDGGVLSIGIGAVTPAMGKIIPPPFPNNLVPDPVPEAPNLESMVSTLTVSQDAWLRAAYRLPEYNPDDLFRQEGYKGINKMLNMSAYSHAIRLKKYAALYRKQTISPAMNGKLVVPKNTGYKKAKEVSDFCEYVLDNIEDEETGECTDFRATLWYLLDAIHTGFSVLEKQYRYIRTGKYKGKVGIARLIPRYPTQITFNIDPFSNRVSSVNNYTPLGGWQSVIPRQKMLLYTYQPAGGLPYGNGDWRQCFKHILSIDVLMRSLSISMQKLGTGLIHATVDSPNDAYLKKVQAMLDSAKDGSSLVTPRGIDVEIISLNGTNLDIFTEALRWHEDQVVKNILGQVLTTTQGDGSSSFALGNVHQDTQNFFLAYPRNDIEFVVRHQLLRPLIRDNFGEDALQYLPIYSLGQFDAAEMNLLATAYSSFIKSGVLSPDEAFIRESAGMPPQLHAPTIAIDKGKEQPDGQQPANGNTATTSPGKNVVTKNVAR